MAKILTGGKESKVSTIVFDKFPHFNFSRRNNFFSSTPLPEYLKNAPEYVMREAITKMEEYRSEVNNYSEEEIDKLYESAVARDTERRNAEIEKAENLLFHETYMHANYEFWNKADFWTADEFVALSFGKEPKHINKKYVEANQSGGRYISEFVKLQFPIKYFERLELVERSRAANPRNVYLPIEEVKLNPKDCIKWAQDKGIKLPDELLKIDKKLKQTNSPSMPKLPAKVHSNMVKVIKYIDDQLEQSCGDNVELSVMIFGKNPNYVFEGFELLSSDNIMLNFSNVSEQMYKILLKLQTELHLISIIGRTPNPYGTISSFKIIVSADFKNRTQHLLEDDNEDSATEKLKAQLQEKENEIEKLKKGKPFGANEKKSLLRMIYGMAVEGYVWKPDATKSSVPTEITADINKNCNKQITDDTVRKWLKEAKQIKDSED